MTLARARESAGGSARSVGAGRGEPERVGRGGRVDRPAPWEGVLVSLSLVGLKRVWELTSWIEVVAAGGQGYELPAMVDRTVYKWWSDFVLEMARPPQ